jgi:imidazolonepropionase-like amidohydrolase
MLRPVFMVGLFSLALAGRSAAEASIRSAEELLIQDVTVVSPERSGPLPHVDVLIRAGRIVKIGPRLVAPGAQTLAGRGRFLIPGLIDSHVHIASPVGFDNSVASARPDLPAAYRAQVPRAYLAFGFTTLIDLAFDPRTGGAFEAAPLHPRLFNCGPGLRIAGGYGAQRLPKTLKPEDAANLVFEPNSASDWPAGLDPNDYSPKKVVARVAKSGAICLKVYVESGFGLFHWPIPSAETLSALHAEASRRGLPMIVHANSVDAWRAALAARSEIIAHGLWQWDGDRLAADPPPSARAMIRQAAQQGASDQPTLRVVYGENSVFDPSLIDDPRYAIAMPRKLVAFLHTQEGAASRRAAADRYRKNFADPPAVVATAARRASATLGLMQAAGVRLLFGTDTPSEEGGIGNPPGLNGRLEMQHWAEAGVPLRRILRAATLDNAKAFGLAKDLGSIEVGKRADLLLLSADPLHDVSAYDTIETIVLDGRPIARDQLRPPD